MLKGIANGLGVPVMVETNSTGLGAGVGVGSVGAVAAGAVAAGTDVAVGGCGVTVGGTRRRGGAVGGTLIAGIDALPPHDTRINIDKRLKQTGIVFMWLRSPLLRG
jgi:hypothetical protein